MEFCNKCGKILLIKIKNEKKIGICSCGFTKEIISESHSYEKIKSPIKRGKGILKQEDDAKGFPHKCKKCGHDNADVEDLGASYSDEASIHLFKCKKCGHVDRQSYGASSR